MESKMSNEDYAWLRYADLQQRSANLQQFSDYSWGIESALNYLLSIIQSGIVPNTTDLEVSLNRAIASGARLHRSRALARSTWVLPVDSASTTAGAEARIELKRIGRTVREADQAIFIDVALGYTDRQIANRHASTPGAIRVRLLRLRRKLAAGDHSVTTRDCDSKPAVPINGVHDQDPQPVGQAA
jgi:hypothetical protein